MNMRCDDIQALLIPYMNQSLEQTEVNQVLTHLATCKACREEVASIIRLNKILQTTLQEVPGDIQISAFDKITASQPVKQTVSIEFDLKQAIQDHMFSSSIGIDILRSVLSPIKRTINTSLKNYEGACSHG